MNQLLLVLEVLLLLLQINQEIHQLHLVLLLQVVEEVLLSLELAHLTADLAVVLFHTKVQQLMEMGMSRLLVHLREILEVIRPLQLAVEEVVQENQADLGPLTPIQKVEDMVEMD